MSRSNNHCDTLLVNHLYHVTNLLMSWAKMIIISFAYSLILIKNIENQGNTIAIARFWISFKIYLVSLKPIFMAASVVRGTI